MVVPFLLLLLFDHDILKIARDGFGDRSLPVAAHPALPPEHDLSEKRGINLAYLLIAVFIFLIQSGEEIKNQKEKLQGTWIQTDGLYTDADLSTGSYKGHALPISTLKVAGDRWMVEIPIPYRKKPNRAEGVYILYPNEEPKRIDIKRNSMIAHGIYKLDDDNLTICYGMAGKTERPNDFGNCVSDGFALVTFKRIK